MNAHMDMNQNIPIKTFTHVDSLIDESSILVEKTDKNNNLRFYGIEGTDLIYPSVTTVTGWSKREFFKEWVKNPLNAQKRDHAASRGDQLHNTIEQYLSNNPNFLDQILDPQFKYLFRISHFYLNKIDNIRALEVPLFSHKLRMAGRVDCIAEYDGVLSVIDFKGSTRIKADSYIQNYHQQATAYAIMYEEMTDVSIQQYVILIATEEGVVQVIKGRPKDHVKHLIETIGKFHNEYNKDKKAS